MSLNSVPSSERPHIGFFGRRNAGKSSLINKIANQSVSVVSPVAGTTTDIVRKAMELLPIGPVVLIDTPGFDDEGELGLLRIEKTLAAISECDVAVLVLDPEKGMGETEKKLIELFTEKKLPYFNVFSKCDLKKISAPSLSSVTGEGIENLLGGISYLLSSEKEERRIIGDLLSPGDTVILVTPIDSASPKGRLILPQVQTLRDILDAEARALVVTEKEYPSALSSLTSPPKMVVTDSRVFKEIDEKTPTSVPLTGFSVLMARYKGTLRPSLSGAKKLSSLKDGDLVLIAEACTHKKQCGDIGTVKLPGMLSAFTQKKLRFSFTSGKDFPENLSPYSLIIQCGGCMITEREAQNRYASAESAGIPITNYGTAIAEMNGILKRACAPFSESL